LDSSPTESNVGVIPFFNRPIGGLSPWRNPVDAALVNSVHHGLIAFRDDDGLAVHAMRGGLIQA
jgi:hypothetical protein